MAKPVIGFIDLVTQADGDGHCRGGLPLEGYYGICMEKMEDDARSDNETCTTSAHAGSEIPDVS